MSDIKIFVSCHQDCYVPDSTILVPIQVGAALTQDRFEGMITDNTGENISHKNKSYCELTAHYWAWKNCDADYYGLFHYRRYLSFNRLHNNTNGIYQLEYTSLSQDTIEDIGLRDELIKSIVKQYDVIVPIECDVSRQYQSQWDQYGNTFCLHIEDMNAMIQVLVERYPQYKQSANEYMQGTRARFCNMFIMSKKYFAEYSEMLFDVLAETEKLINFANYSVDEYRVMGHLSERLLGIYAHYLINYTDAIVGELRMVKIGNTAKTDLKPAFSSNNIALAFSCSNYFIPYFGVLLQSIVENSSASNNYDIVVLCNNMSDANKHILNTIIKEKENVSLRFFDVSNFLKGYHFSVKQHVAIETWYRLFLPVIMSNYEKVIYLDCDIIVNSDIAELYNIDMGNYLMAAARDLAIIGLYNYDIGNARQHIDNEVRLDNPYNYFQAGVVLFNLQKMRELYDVNELLELGQSRKWEWLDQDVLNRIANKQVLILDQTWNVEHDRNRKRITEMRRAPMELFQQYLNAREAPKIVHFAGADKPWLSPECDMSEYFWKYARRCNTYEIIIGRLMSEKDKATVQKQLSTKKVQVIKKKNWREKAKEYSLPLLPKGSRRRSFVKKIYLKVFCPQAWSIRSDLKMHLKIYWRKILSVLPFGKLHRELKYFASIKNRHEGERCFITCTGPSLKIDDLNKLENEYTFGVNSIIMAYSKTQWRPTYYAMVDIYNLGRFLQTHPVVGGKFAQREAFLHYRTKIKYETGNEKYCLINYLNHKQRRLKKQKYKLSNNPGVCMYDCFTVTNIAIQLAVFMGFKEIYLIGADCNYDPAKMHFIETEIDDAHRGAKWLPAAVDLSVQGYRAAKEFAEKHGVKIFNATRGGHLEVFERVDFDSIALK